MSLIAYRGPYLRPWRATGGVADYWETVRKSMKPSPLPARFIAACDAARDEALASRSEWKQADLYTYVRDRVVQSNR